jgi:hypothetical protein
MWFIFQDQKTKKHYAIEYFDCPQNEDLCSLRAIKQQERTIVEWVEK